MKVVREEGYMRHESMIVPEGLPFIVPLAVAVAVAFFYNAQILAAFLLLLLLFVLNFFRNPERIFSGEERALLSPADGRVIRVDDKASHELIDGSCRKISIFMNVFNVHVNRAPCSGVIESIRYEKGEFLSADKDAASEQNEKNALLIRTGEGRKIVTVQVAGLIARRIVCWLKEGMEVRKGERFGMIRFGSRLDVFLPRDASVSVKIGDKVRAGETPIGYWP
jgi:phosphatidylserine decarboxylase